MTYPGIALLGGIGNALIGITWPSWPNVLIAVVVIAYSLSGHARS